MKEKANDAELNIDHAVRVIQNTIIHRRINVELGKEDGDSIKRSPYTWSAVIPILERDLSGHQMSRGTYNGLWEGVEHAPEELKERYVAALAAWRSTAWPSFREELVAELADKFGSYYFTETKLQEHLARWPELRTERRVIAAGLTSLRAAGAKPNEALSNLAELRGSEDDARASIAIVSTAGASGYGERLAELIHAWLGETTWGQLMTSLYAPIPEAHAPPKHVAELAYLLRQVPLTTGPSLDGFILDDMSGSSRATWRRSIAVAVTGDGALRSAATEAMLWFAHSREDLFSQFTALEINDPDQVAALEWLLSHPSRLVALRAQSALDLLANEPDPLEVLLTKEPARESAAPALPASRTWLGDARLEQLLRTAFAEAAMSMAREVPATASSGEENLVGKLFERLRGACETVSERAAILARETDRGERLTISLSHRVIGRTEEGADGLVKGVPFSTDVTVILRARRGAEKPFSERATFIQAKRLRRGKAPAGEHYSVDMTQMDDIARQTSSSFLLAVGPEALGVTMPVVPAQLLVDQLGVTVKERQLHPDRVARLGRSLAGWLVDDVIGLWTGDHRKRAVKKAASGAGDRDTILVEISVAMVPIEPELDGRKR